MIASRLAAGAGDRRPAGCCASSGTPGTRASSSGSASCTACRRRRRRDRPDHGPVLARRALRITQATEAPLYMFTPDRRGDPAGRRHLPGQPRRPGGTDRLPAARGPPAHPGDHRLPRRRPGAVPQPDHHRAAVHRPVHLQPRAERQRRHRGQRDPGDPACRAGTGASPAGSSTASSAPSRCPAAKRQDFPVPVNAFVADSVDTAARPVPADQQHQAAAARAGHRTPAEDQHAAAAAPVGAPDSRPRCATC